MKEIVPWGGFPLGYGCWDEHMCPLGNTVLLRNETLVVPACRVSACREAGPGVCIGHFLHLGFLVPGWDKRWACEMTAILQSGTG